MLEVHGLESGREYGPVIALRLSRHDEEVEPGRDAEAAAAAKRRSARACM